MSQILKKRKMGEVRNSTDTSTGHFEMMELFKKDEEIEELKRQLTHSSKKLIFKEELIMSLKDAIDSTKQTCSRVGLSHDLNIQLLQDQCNQLKMALNQLHDENSAYKNRNRELKAENSELKEILSGLKSDLERAKPQIAKYKAENMRLDAKINAIQSQNSNYNDHKISTLLKKMKQKNKMFEEKTEEAEKLKVDLAAKHVNFCKMTDLYMQQKNLCDQKDAEIAKFNLAINGMSAKPSKRNNVKNKYI